MKTTLQNQIDAFKKGVIIDSDGNQNACFNFYDWFCRDTSLKRKAEGLFIKLIRILPLFPDINPDTTYCFFKNNCPCDGSLYDDFRICDIESGDVIFTITPASGFNKNKGEAEIWGKLNNFEGAIRTASSWSKLLKDLKTNPLK